MNKEGNKATQKEFLENMEKKIEDAYFAGDMNGLLKSEIAYEFNEVHELVKKDILQKI